MLRILAMALGGAIGTASRYGFLVAARFPQPKFHGGMR